MAINDDFTMSPTGKLLAAADLAQFQQQLQQQLTPTSRWVLHEAEWKELPFVLNGDIERLGLIAEDIEFEIGWTKDVPKATGT